MMTQPLHLSESLLVQGLSQLSDGASTAMIIMRCPKPLYRRSIATSVAFSVHV
jgi:hypothetical protein